MESNKKSLTLTRSDWNLLKASLHMFMDEAQDELELFEDNRMDDAVAEQRDLVSKAQELFNKIESV